MALLVRATMLVAAAAAVAGLNNGLARLPPMGFANWNGFGCNYNDTTFRRMADAITEKGLDTLGYRTMIIQECIVPAGHRNASGVLQPDPVKFPYGIDGLVDYIHSKGLLAGIYTDVGPQTCAGYEGSFDHEQIDAKTFAAWGIDFVEEDSCHHPPGHPYEELYGRMRDALNATGRPIVFYSCVQGQENVYQWGPSTANLWRTTSDICAPGVATWGRMLSNFYGNARYPNVTGPGQWQDPDMLVVGMSGLTPTEWRTHFTLWCISAAPLWLGVDLTTIPQEALDIVSNKEVVDVDQDPLGIQGRLASATPQHQLRVYDDNEAVTLQSCDVASNWTINKTDSTIRAAGQCMTSEGCGSGNENPAIMYACVGQSGGCPKNQQFTMTSEGNIVNALSGKCITAQGGNGTTAFFDTCESGNTAQQFVMGPSGKLRLAQGDKLCLTAGGSVRVPAQAWYKPLATRPGTKQVVAVALFNPDDSVTQQASISFAAANLDPSMPVMVRNANLQKDLGNFTGSYSQTLPAHDSVMLILTQ